MKHRDKYRTSNNIQAGLIRMLSHGKEKSTTLMKSNSLVELVNKYISICLIKARPNYVLLLTELLKSRN